MFLRTSISISKSDDSFHFCSNVSPTDANSLRGESNSGAIRRASDLEHLWQYLHACHIHVNGIVWNKSERQNCLPVNGLLGKAAFSGMGLGDCVSTQGERGTFRPVRGDRDERETTSALPPPQFHRSLYHNLRGRKFEQIPPFTI